MEPETQGLLMISPLKFLVVWFVAIFGVLQAQAQFSFDQIEPGAKKVTTSVVVSSNSVAPGGTAAIAVILDHQPGWHVHINTPPELPDFVPIATELADLEVTGAEVGPIQWPEVHVIKVSFTGPTIDYPVFEGRAPIYVPLKIPDDAAGEVRVKFELVYQACDDTMCEPPEFVPYEVTIKIDPDAEGSWAPEFDEMDRTVFERSWSGAGDAPGPGDVSGTDADASSEGSSFFGFVVPRGLLALAFFGALGGLVLNLTPCVLPVIPLKVMALTQHGASKGRTLTLGLWMAFGVFAFWLGIGLPVAFLTSVTDPSQIFGIWWVTLGIGVLIAVMGVGIMGVFEIKLPDKIYALNPKANTAKGSFLFGIMTAVLGLPCFGFIAGGLLAGAATMPATDILTVFGSIGFGMAAPYLILAAKPQWVEFIPRTGPASELVKQVMGLLLFSAAAFFLGSGIMALVKADPVRAAQLPVWAKVALWWAVAFFATAAGGWLAWRTFRISPKALNRVVFLAIGVVLSGVAVMFATGQTEKAMHDIWVPFSDDLLADAIAEGNVVVIDFTADWCLNCQALKVSVLDREPVHGLLMSSGVVPMIADLTSRKAIGWEKLRALGQTGIPLLAIYGPGFDEPWMSNGYTRSQVAEAIEQARGTREVTRADE
jgi:suppressor for copper-sensitivity B